MLVSLCLQHTNTHLHILIFAQTAWAARRLSPAEAHSIITPNETSNLVIFVSKQQNWKKFDKKMELEYPLQIETDEQNMITLFCHRI